ncbi:MAG: ABC transporter permease [Dehalococcoidia bacterium]|nr:ABC transporter permease [Dehalococcoidia bacterium]
MQQYIVRRLILLFPVVIGVSFLVFAVMHMVPGDTVMLRLAESPTASQRDIEELRQELGLDEPFLVQYLNWLGDLVRGDLGRSLWTNDPVASDIMKRMPVTAELGVLAALISAVMGISAGVVSAVRQDSVSDYFTRIVMTLGLAVPNFALATLVLVLLGLWFEWSPGVWYHSLADDPVANLRQMFLPALLLGFSLSASIARMTRSSMLEVLRQDYVRTATAKGLAARTVIFRHALKNAMPPVLTIIGLQFGFLLGGAVVIESIFGLPGLGRLMLDAINQRDYVLIQGAVFVIATTYVLINIVVDVSYGLLDPRIRYA